MEEDNSIIATALYKVYGALTNFKPWGATVTVKEDLGPSTRNYLIKNWPDHEIESEKIEESLGSKNIKFFLKKVVKKAVNPTNNTGGNLLIYIVIILVIVWALVQYVL